MLGELQPWFAGWPSVERFRKDMDELVERFLYDGGHQSLNMATWPAVESFFKDNRWIMRFDLPGVDPQDIDVSVTRNTLTIRASRERRIEDGSNTQSFSRFERTLTLPQGVESGQIDASYKHGVLELAMPASPELVGRKVPIEIATEENKQLEHQAAAQQKSTHSNDS